MKKPLKKSGLSTGAAIALITLPLLGLFLLAVGQAAPGIVCLLLTVFCIGFATREDEGFATPATPANATGVTETFCNITTGEVFQAEPHTIAALPLSQRTNILVHRESGWQPLDDSILKAPSPLLPQIRTDPRPQSPPAPPKPLSGWAAFAVILIVLGIVFALAGFPFPGGSVIGFGLIVLLIVHAARAIAAGPSK